MVKTKVAKKLFFLVLEAHISWHHLKQLKHLIHFFPLVSLENNPLHRMQVTSLSSELFEREPFEILEMLLCRCHSIQSSFFSQLFA